MSRKQSLPKKARITSTNEFNQIIKSGKCLRWANYKAHFIEKSDPKSRIGVIVSRQIKQKALKNRFKRVIKEYFRNNRPLFNKNIDLVVIVYNAQEEKSFFKIEQILKKEKLLS